MSRAGTYDTNTKIELVEVRRQNPKSKSLFTLVSKPIVAAGRSMETTTLVTKRKMIPGLLALSTKI
jgi:hypothetical protein